MKNLLHILTTENDLLGGKIIDHQKSQPENQVEVVNLTEENSDYKILLQKIFAADSVQVW